VGAGIAVLPVVLATGAPPIATVSVAVAVGTGAALAIVDRLSPLTAVARARAALVLTTLAVIALAVLVAVDPAARPEPYLMVAASLSVALASAPAPRLRWSFQVLVIATVAYGYQRADRTLAETLLVLGGLLVLAALGDVFSEELRRARRSENQARRDAERRAELLVAVKTLPARSPASAARACVETMRALAYDTAGVAVLGDDGALHAMYTDTQDMLVLPQLPGQGMAWVALDRDETVSSSDYNLEAYALPGRDQVRSAVVTPVRVEGRPTGVVIGARRTPRMPTRAEVEIVEVLARHLGAVLENERIAARQRELLERMAELDTMREGFVGAVSAEVRDPLTIVRGIASVLRVHGVTLDDERRVTFLDTLCAKSEELRELIDTLLDFSRFQAVGVEPGTRSVELAPLLEPLVRDGGLLVRGHGGSALAGVTVAVDADLLVPAIELLLAKRSGSAPREPGSLWVEMDDEEVRLRVRGGDGGPSALLRSLASQLVVAAGAEIDGADPPTLHLRRRRDAGRSADSRDTEVSQ
jgi:K+-sensing histidine kinase KdpD